jgi:hypothetical protein
LNQQTSSEGLVLPLSHVLSSRCENSKLQFSHLTDNSVILMFMLNNAREMKKTLGSLLLLHYNNIGDSQALVAQALDPNYSGGSDQEDQDSKPAQTNSL